jgi:hypothetical protein
MPLSRIKVLILVSTPLWTLYGAFPGRTAKTRPVEQPAVPEGAIVLFDGKSLAGWTAKNGGPAPWKVENGYLEVVPGKGDIQSRQVFGDCRLHLEFWVPRMEGKHGQDRGNSGIFLQSRYEIQVLDSYQNDTYPDGACGALYKAIAPAVNACKPPEQWQTYDITFHSPRVGGQEGVVEKGWVTVVHNGIPVIDHGEFDQPTGSAHGMRQGPWGPVRLQDHGAAVRYRNIWIKPLTEHGAR